MVHWHHILDDPVLNEHEKMVALAIIRLNGNFLAPAPNLIVAPIAKISIRQVQRCKTSLKKIGTLVERVVRGKSGYVSLYKVIERQGSLLGQKPGMAVVTASSLSSPGSEGKARPPTAATISHPLSGGAKATTKSNTAHKCAQIHQSEQNEKAKEEWERRQFAKNRRLAIERAVAAETRIGCGPRPSAEWRARREGAEEAMSFGLQILMVVALFIILGLYDHYFIGGYWRKP